MKIFSKVKDFVYKVDFFNSTQLLRYKNEPQYRTLFGGVFSLIIIIALIVTFYNMVVNTLDKIIIFSDAENTNAADPDPYDISTFPEDQFMFGVQIWHHDLNTGPRYFDIVMTSVEFDTGQRRSTSVIYPMQPCLPEHWDIFPQIKAEYSRLNMNYWLCPPKNMKYEIRGKYASVYSKTLQIAVNKCTNNSREARDCATQADIDQYFIDQGNFFYTIYFINPLVNPTSQQYLKYYLEDNNYIIFTDQFGSQGILFMQQFDITTDESIFPVKTYQEESGGIVTQMALKNPYQVTTSMNTYCSFAFFKSGTSRSYDRSFQKIDQVLSYIGGLFGTIAIVLFLVNIYNGYSFQITLGAYLFHNKDQKQQNKFKKYNFWHFLTHLLYTVFRIIGFSPNWQLIKQYDSCRRQMLKQLDMLYLLQRVFYLQKSLNIMLDQHHLKGLHLQQKPTLSEAKVIRKKFKLKQRIMKQCQKIQDKKKGQQCDSNLVELNSKIFPSKIANKFTTQYNINDNLNNMRLNGERTSEKQFVSDIIFPKQNVNVANTRREQSSSDSSSGSQSDPEFDINEQIHQLRRQARKGDKISQKVWNKINHQMKRQLRSLLNNRSDQTFQDQQYNSEDQANDRNNCSIQQDWKKNNQLQIAENALSPQKLRISSDDFKRSELKRIKKRQKFQSDALQQKFAENAAEQVNSKKNFSNIIVQNQYTQQ